MWVRTHICRVICMQVYSYHKQTRTISCKLNRITFIKYTTQRIKLESLMSTSFHLVSIEHNINKLSTFAFDTTTTYQRFYYFAQKCKAFQSSICVKLISIIISICPYDFPPLRKIKFNKCVTVFYVILHLSPCWSWWYIQDMSGLKDTSFMSVLKIKIRQETKMLKKLINFNQNFLKYFWLNKKLWLEWGMRYVISTIIFCVR